MLALKKLSQVFISPVGYCLCKIIKIKVLWSCLCYHHKLLMLSAIIKTDDISQNHLFEVWKFICICSSENTSYVNFLIFTYSRIKFPNFNCTDPLLIDFAMQMFPALAWVWGWPVSPTLLPPRRTPTCLHLHWFTNLGSLPSLLQVCGSLLRDASVIACS